MARMGSKPITSHAPTDHRYCEALQRLNDLPPHIRRRVCAWIATAFTTPEAIAMLAEDTEDTAEHGRGWRTITLHQRIAYEFVLSVYGHTTQTVGYLEQKKELE